MNFDDIKWCLTHFKWERLDNYLWNFFIDIAFLGIRIGFVVMIILLWVSIYMLVSYGIKMILKKFKNSN